jgi:uncharacterized membrane protein
MLQIAHEFSSLGFMLIFLGIIVVVIGFAMFACQHGGKESVSGRRSQGVILIGPIPIAWGVSPRTYRYIVVIAVAVFIFWLVLFLF